MEKQQKNTVQQKVQQGTETVKSQHVSNPFIDPTAQRQVNPFIDVTQRKKNPFLSQSKQDVPVQMTRGEGGKDEKEPPKTFCQKPLLAEGTSFGGGFISGMGQQFNPAFRTEGHSEVLKANEGNCPVKTFDKENSHARNYPYEGSYSKLGDMGITAHKGYGWIKDKFS
jgi:hypothetical protein